MRGTQNPGGIRDGANGSGEPLPRPLLRPSPSANLVGNWKGDPLGPQVAVPSGFPNNQPELCPRASRRRQFTIVVSPGAFTAVTDRRHSPTVVNRALNEAQQNPVLYQLKALEVEKARVEKWDGRF